MQIHAHIDSDECVPDVMLSAAIQCTAAIDKIVCVVQGVNWSVTSVRWGPSLTAAASACLIHPLLVGRLVATMDRLCARVRILLSRVMVKFVRLYACST